MTITLEQAAERFIPHEFTIDGLDTWLTNQNIDVDGDSRFFHSWHHYENALDEANANVCIRELKGMDADCWTNHDSGIIVHMRDENGEPTISRTAKARFAEQRDWHETIPTESTYGTTVPSGS